MTNLENHPTTVISEVKKYLPSGLEDIRDRIAVEVPILIKFNGRKYVVMMASPSDFEDFGIGFALSEGLLENIEQIYSISYEKVEKGISININVSDECIAKIFEINRNLEGRTGCGLCGISEIDNALRSLKVLKIDSLQIEMGLIFSALENLPDKQIINSETGSVHAAAFFNSNGDLIQIREDVGRHNALDKLIGFLAKSKINIFDGFIVITSRCSMEMVQKTITIGCPILVSVSAPTSLAIDIANQNNLTVLAFARKEKINIYTHSSRIL